MNYSIDVTLNNKDYYNFNDFIFLKSKKGKKQLLSFRIIIAAIIAFFPILYLITGTFTATTLIPFALLLIIYQLLLIPFYRFLLKLRVKSLNKHGKPLYSNTAHLDFGDDTFTETTSDGKDELRYSAVEFVSVYGEYVYIHKNSALAYIVPRSAFQNDGDFSAFIEFLKEKCATVDIY